MKGRPAIPRVRIFATMGTLLLRMTAFVVLSPEAGHRVESNVQPIRAPHPLDIVTGIPKCQRSGRV